MSFRPNEITVIYIGSELGNVSDSVYKGVISQRQKTESTTIGCQKMCEFRRLHSLCQVKSTLHTSMRSKSTLALPSFSTV